MVEAATKGVTGLPTPTLNGLPPELKALIVSFTAEVDNEEMEWAEVDTEDEEEEEEDAEEQEDGKMGGMGNQRAKGKRPEHSDSDSESTSGSDQMSSSLLRLCLVNKEFAALCQEYIWELVDFSGKDFVQRNYFLQIIFPRRKHLIKMLTFDSEEGLGTRIGCLQRLADYGKEIRDTDTTLVPTLIKTIVNDIPQVDADRDVVGAIDAYILRAIASQIETLEFVCEGLEYGRGAPSPGPDRYVEAAKLAVNLKDLSIRGQSSGRNVVDFHHEKNAGSWLADLLSCLPKLERLEVGLEINRRDDRQLFKVLTNMDKLSNLFISEGNYVTDELANLKWRAPLKVLALTKCENLSFEGFRRLVEQFKSTLEVLDIDETPHNNSEAENSRLLGKPLDLPKLDTLVLSTLHDSKFLDSFKAHALVEFELGYCPAFEYSAVEEFVLSHASTLKQVTLAGDHTLTDGSVESLEVLCHAKGITCTVKPSEYDSDDDEESYSEDDDDDEDEDNWNGYDDEDEQDDEDERGYSAWTRRSARDRGNEDSHHRGNEDSHHRGQLQPSTAGNTEVHRNNWGARDDGNVDDNDQDDDDDDDDASSTAGIRRRPHRQVATRKRRDSTDSDESSSDGQDDLLPGVVRSQGGGVHTVTAAQLRREWDEQMDAQARGRAEDEAIAEAEAEARAMADAEARGEDAAPPPRRRRPFFSDEPWEIRGAGFTDENWTPRENRHWNHGQAQSAARDNHDDLAQEEDQKEDPRDAWVSDNDDVRRDGSDPSSRASSDREDLSSDDDDDDDALLPGVIGSHGGGAADRQEAAADELRRNWVVEMMAQASARSQAQPGNNDEAAEDARITAIPSDGEAAAAVAPGGTTTASIQSDNESSIGRARGISEDEAEEVTDSRTKSKSGRMGRRRRDDSESDSLSSSDDDDDLLPGVVKSQGGGKHQVSPEDLRREWVQNKIDQAAHAREREQEQAKQRTAGFGTGHGAPSSQAGNSGGWASQVAQRVLPEEEEGKEQQQQQQQQQHEQEQDNASWHAIAGEEVGDDDDDSSEGEEQIVYPVHTNHSPAAATTSAPSSGWGSGWS